MSFYIKADEDDTYTANGEALSNMTNPFVLHVVSKFAKILSNDQLEELHQSFNEVWDIFMDTPEQMNLIDSVPGGDELLHILINMKHFVRVFKQVHQVCNAAKDNINAAAEHADADDVDDAVGDDAGDDAGTADASDVAPQQQAKRPRK